MILHVILLSFLCVFFRIIFLVIKITTTQRHNLQRGNVKTAKTLIIIGSGGHTAEMLRLINKLDHKFFSPRYYLMASTDTSSEVKVKTFEEAPKNEETTSTDYYIIKIPRSRSVKQSYFTSIFTTPYSFFLSVPIILQIRPTLILCNGPGTCIPVCLVSFIMKVFFISNTYIVFVESVCRVKTLSLTGKFLLYIADNIFVQWPNLHELYTRTHYIGRLV